MYKNFFPGGAEIPWLLTVYPGCLIVPLALLGSFRRFSPKRAIWIFLFLATLGLALGDHTPLYRLFYLIFPTFRFPEKFMVVASLSLLVLAAFELDHLLAACRKKGFPPGRFVVVLLAVLVVDLFAANRYLNPTCDPAFYRYHYPDLAPVIGSNSRHRVFVDPELPRPAGEFNTIQNAHVQWQRYLIPNTGLLQNISHVGGASGLELNHQYVITEMILKPWPEKIQFLRLANVKYVVSTRRLVAIPGMAHHLQQVNASVYRIKNPLPRAWVVGRLQPAPREVLAGLSDLSFDMWTTALVRENIAAQYAFPYFLPVKQVDYQSGNRIVIEALLEQPGVLVLTESAYPGWRVTVNGVARKILNINFLFQGVELDKGHHRIEFTFRPLYFDIFLSVSLAALVLCFSGWIVWTWRYCRKRNLQ